MKFIRTIATGVLACMTVAVMAADYTTEGQFVTIPVKNVKAGGAQVVRLQVVNDNIIRVQATSKAQLPQKQSLMIVQQTAKPKFTVTDGDKVSVKAANVEARVDKETGAVTFYDANGNKTTSKETTYSYDDSNYQVSQQIVSDGQNTESVRYWYPLNSENQSTGLSHLINKNCLSEVTGVETYRNGFFTGGSKFNYTTNNIGIPVVEECYSILPDSNRTNVLEMKVTGYDNYGNIREYEKKDGTPVTILWSYSHQYPVMEIVGKRYEDIKSDEVVFMENPTRFPTESRIRSVHNTIRQKNPDAHVTAYIYTPWHTISRIISPNGYEVNYGYDSFGRLIKVGDDSGVLQKYQYNYKIK